MQFVDMLTSRSGVLYATPNGISMSALVQLPARFSRMSLIDDNHTSLGLEPRLDRSRDFASREMGLLSVCSSSRNSLEPGPQAGTGH